MATASTIFPSKYLDQIHEVLEKIVSQQGLIYTQDGHSATGSALTASIVFEEKTTLDGIVKTPTGLKLSSEFFTKDTLDSMLEATL